MDVKDAVNLTIAALVVGLVVDFVPAISQFVKVVDAPIGIELIWVAVGFAAILFVSEQLKKFGIKV